MREWDLLETAPVPDDDAVVSLWVCGNEYAIDVDDDELMTTRQHGSEAALADEALDRVPDVDRARVLVGGLGMGFTLRAALDRVGPDAQVVVAELIEAVVRWNQQLTGHAAGHPLRDPRTRVHLGDVADLVDDPPQPWTAILLDVDNGPFALTRRTNGWLYTDHGIHAAWNALEPGGVLGVWSADHDPELTECMEHMGFDVEVIEVFEDGRPTPEDDGVQVVWVAVKPR